MTRHTIYNIIRSSAVLLALIALFACSDDNDNVRRDKQRYPLYPILGQGNRVATRFPISVGGTAVEYEGFDEAYPTPIKSEYKTIGIFLAQDTVDNQDTYVGIKGRWFTYNKGYRWGTTVEIEPEEGYYMFGFMPAVANSGAEQVISRLTDGTNKQDWKYGAHMLYRNLAALTGADISVIVAVKSGDPTKSIDDQLDIVEEAIYTNITMGNHYYRAVAPATSATGATIKNNNCVYLLLDHLYSNINLEMMVDKDYAELRTIKLTRVKMESSDVTSRINLELDVNNINLDPSKKLIDNVQYTPDGSTSATAELFPISAEPEEMEICEEGYSWKKNDNGDYILDAQGDKIQDYTSIPGFFAPVNENMELKFTFEYNVYDKKGNLVRAKCKAVNTWRKTKDLLGSVPLVRGLSFRIKAKINPTYLYQLSEPDLDNPTITLE